MKTFEEAQASLKQYNQSVRHAVIHLTGGNDDAVTTPTGAKKDCATVNLFSAQKKQSTEKKVSESNFVSIKDNNGADKHINTTTADPWKEVH
jgi:hypothetical protein